jgi:inorganic triphosphatase YgiF
MTIMRERELKLASTPNEMPHLKQALLEMAIDGHVNCSKSFDTYYDTANDKLRREGVNEITIAFKRLARRKLGE